MLAAAALPGPVTGSAQGGRSSGVEHNLAKVGVEGSNPFARSRFFAGIDMAFLLYLALQVEAPSAAVPAAGAAQTDTAVVTTASGLRFQVLQAGTGRRPKPGDAVLVTYEGRLADGTIFDSAAQPVGLRVSDLVPGFAEAVRRMNEGGRYRFWIPPRLAYGAQGSRGVVPPDAELDFTLTLIRVGRPAR